MSLDELLVAEIEAVSRRNGELELRLKAAQQRLAELEAQPPFAVLAAAELAHARAKYPKHASLYESYAVLKFEFDEVESEIKSHYRCGSRLLVELAQLAASCQRAAEDAGLVTAQNAQKGT